MLSGVAAVSGEHTCQSFGWKRQPWGSSQSSRAWPSQPNLGTPNREKAEAALTHTRLPPTLPARSPMGFWVVRRCWATFTQADPSVLDCWDSLSLDRTPLKPGAHSAALPEWSRHRQSTVIGYKTSKRMSHSWYLELQIVFNDPIMILFFFPSWKKKIV